jgi:hypothetical protein
VLATRPRGGERRGEQGVESDEERTTSPRGAKVPELVWQMVARGEIGTRNMKRTGKEGDR